MTYSGHLEELVGIRWTIISGASIMSLGVILTSISIQVRKRAILITNEKNGHYLSQYCTEVDFDNIYSGYRQGTLIVTLFILYHLNYGLFGTTVLYGISPVCLP